MGFTCEHDDGMMVLVDLASITFFARRSFPLRPLLEAVGTGAILLDHVPLLFMLHFDYTVMSLFVR